MRRSMSPPWDTHAGNCRLSECNPPGVLECGPGLEGIAPVYSVVQQETLQEQHVSRLPFGIHQRHAGAMVPIFSESAGSVEKICGRGPVDRYRAAPAGAWSIRPAGSTQLKPGTISRPAGPYGTSAAENLRTPGRNSSPRNTLRSSVFRFDDADATFQRLTRHSSV